MDKQRVKLQQKIDKFTNEEILANDLEILADNMYQEFYISPVVIESENLSKRKVNQTQITRAVDPFFRSVYERDTVQLDGMSFDFYYHYTGDDMLFRCQASTFSMGGYPEIELEEGHVVFSISKTLRELEASEAKEKIMSEIEHNVNSVRKGIEYCNSDIKNFNTSLKGHALRLLEEKRKKVQAYYSVAAMFEVPVTRNDFSSTHISVKRKISPISHSYNQEPYYCLKDEDYKDILDAIKHTASTYERTPASYKGMHEEDLRNALLATLNAMYQGGVMGEAFRNKGKTDIAIERESRAAFVAECKMWNGPKEILPAIEQLDGYLTWRDCKAALIYFVRRKDFLKVLNSAKETITSFENVRSIEEVDKNEFACTITSNTNPGQLTKVRVMLFNLYAEDCK